MPVRLNKVYNYQKVRLDGVLRSARNGWNHVLLLRGDRLVHSLFLSGKHGTVERRFRSQCHLE